MDIIAADVDKRLATQAAWATADKKEDAAKEAEDKKATEAINKRDEQNQQKGTSEEKLEAGCKELLKTPLPKATTVNNSIISRMIQTEYDAKKLSIN